MVVSPAPQEEALYALHPKQVEALYLMGLDPEDVLEDPVQELLYGGEGGSAKALSLETPIAVPGGWTTMGELREGDAVFALDGSTTRVVACTEVMVGRPCYEVVFSDGARIVADEQHLWLTLTYQERINAGKMTEAFRARRRAARPSRATGRRSAAFTAALSARNSARPPATKSLPMPAVRTTGAIRDTLVSGAKQANNHAVPVAQPLLLPWRWLPVDPYVLGAWLGDGTSDGGGFTTADEEMLTHLEAGGYQVRKGRARYYYSVLGLRRPLRIMGLLKNKHIPQDYLRGSMDQRLALLQGLMDTDGTCGRDDGHCSFTTTRKALADGVAELLATLGIKAVAREGVAKLNGRVIGPKWNLHFSTDLPCFRLTRKLARQKRDGFLGTQKWRYITDVRPVDSVPVRCIQVDHPSGTYLAGREMVPTHNSHLVRAWSLYLAKEYWPGCKVGLFRRTFRQLEDTHILEFLRTLPKGSYHYSAESHDFTFPNGSIIQCRFCADEADVFNYWSAEWDALAIDEAAQFSKDQITMLRSRVRSPRAGWRRMILYTTNPIGPGEPYLLEHFVDPAPEGTVFGATDLEEGEERWPRCFLHARLADNPSLSEAQYRATLSGISDPAVRDAMLRGIWRRGVGFKFREFDRVKHTCRPFVVPREWPKFGGHDYGHDDPCGFVWFAKVPPGQELPVADEQYRVSSRWRILAYRELEESGLFAQQQALRIHVMSQQDGGAPRLIWSGHDMFARHQGGATGAEEFGAALLPLIPGQRDRAAGWGRIHRALDSTDYDAPELCIMDTCPVLIKQLAGAQRDPAHPEDILEPHGKLGQDDTIRSHWDVLNAARMGLSGGAVVRVKERRGSYTMGGG